MNPRPDAGVSCLLAGRPSLIGVLGEEVRQDLGPGCREGGVIRWIARKVRHWKQGHYRGLQLRWTNVPVGELAVLTGDEYVELRHRQKRIYARCPRRILIQPVFKHPTIRQRV